MKVVNNFIGCGAVLFSSLSAAWGEWDRHESRDISTKENPDMYEVRYFDNSHDFKYVTQEHRVPFADAGYEWGKMGQGLSEPLGWVVWKTPSAMLCEVDSLTGIDKDKNEDMDRKGAIVYDPATKKFNKISLKQYSEWGLKKRLGIYQGNANGDEHGSAVLLTIRDSFSYFNANQEGFSFDYAKTNGESALRTKGAVVFDIYSDFLYNRNATRLGDMNPYRISFRTGVEFDRDDEAEEPVDRTSFYFLTNFQGNPSQKARVLGVDDLGRVISPQFLQFGVAVDHDEFTGGNDLRWIIGWQPQFYLPEDAWGSVGETFGINRKMFYKKGTPLQLYKPRDLVENGGEDPSVWYSYIPADVKLSDSAALFRKALGNDDGTETFVEWKGGLVFGNGESKFRFGYLAEGVTAVAGDYSTHLGHSFFAEIALGNVSTTYVDTQKKTSNNKKDPSKITDLPDTDLGAMTIFAKYTMGEFQPTFEESEIFQVGTRIRF